MTAPLRVVRDGTAEQVEAFHLLAEQKNKATAAAVEAVIVAIELTDTLRAVAALVDSMRLPCECAVIGSPDDPERVTCEACLLRGLLGLDA